MRTLGQTLGQKTLAKLLLATVAVLVALGCDGGPADQRLASAKVWRGVENATGVGVELVEVWSTGNGPRFGYVTDMMAWADGTVWIADAETGRVSWVGPNGEIKCCIATEARGDVASIDALANGGAVVMGLLSRRALFYSARKSLFHDAPLPDIWSRGVVGLPDGRFMVSGGLRGTEASRYAIHRFDSRGTYLNSFHPALEHHDPKAVHRLSGGPLAVTTGGDLLMAAAAPFQITRYRDARPDNPQLVVEDHTIVSPAQLSRALVPEDPHVTYSPRWNRTIYVGEMSDGNILSVVHLYPDNPRAPVQSLWVVVAPDGNITARTTFAAQFHVWDTTPDGRFLVSYVDPEKRQELAAEVEVLLKPVEEG